MPRHLLAVLPLAAVIAAGAGVQAGGRADDWCDDEGWGEGVRHCEVREIDLGAARSFSVDSAPNGGVHVEGGDQAGARLSAKVSAQGADEAEARDLAARVQIETDGTIRASGPEARSRRHWSVSYRLRVPRQADLDLQADNGGIHISGVSGTIRFRTVNGGVHLDGVAGDVSGRTVNGGLHVRLDGAGWEGAGLDARTSNGGVSLAVGDGYRGHLETGTVNGHIDVDFPVTMQGRLGKSLAFDLAGGGPPLRLHTTNGGVKVRRLP
jgi:hypothetical protein